jgi:DHA1 family inner membrane transport protein
MTGPSSKPNWAIVALAAGAFGIGATEFSPMGLLPTIATGLGVSIPFAGLLVSAYALGVMLGAPVMTLVLGGLPRKTALLLLMLIFSVGNLLAAVSPNYVALLAARVFTSLAHGAFFGLGSVVASALVPREKAASAIAGMFMGLTIANIGGVPAATWIGQEIGWRAAFAAIAVLGLAAMGSLAVALPRTPTGARPDIRRELDALSQPAVLVALATTVLGAGAMFTLFTYIAPVLGQITGTPPAFTTAMLVLIGVGFTAGNAAGGRLADRSLDGSLIIFLSALTIAMAAFPFTAATRFGAGLTLMVWAGAAFAIVPPLQMRVLQAASDAPGLASAVNIGAFNLGNAIGAALGGAVVALGRGYAAVPVAGGGLAALCLGLVLVGRAVQSRLAARSA